MPKVASIIPLDDYRLDLRFDSAERRIFQTRPYLDKGIFVELKDPSYFRQVRIEYGTVTWPNEQDFSPETLYIESVACQAA